MYLLDTNICIYAMKGKFPALAEKLLRIAPSEIFVSSVTVGELEYGAAKSKWGDRSRNVMNIFLSPYTVIPFDEKDARTFGKIRALLNRQGMPIGPYDLQIAAQGLSRNLTVITHNVGEFSRVPNLTVEDWTLSM
ncbi:MAG: type II toxin-antitoxin system VapC family toxin [Selenomonadaceae bacterium]|nr:type II toxin-antitoxin system VapC family toxin [Selenomonadaceae bacterium]MBR4695065.1 type II toxin-antitoxin system VapC family toxin [Selenomonadaceae bacterium]